MKQLPAKKIKQALRNLMSLLVEIRLKVNDGTHSTSVNVRFSKIKIVPMCVTRTTEPLGSLTKLETTAVMVVNNEGQLIILPLCQLSKVYDMN
jgi:hypothetical protein